MDAGEGKAVTDGGGGSMPEEKPYEAPLPETLSTLDIENTSLIGFQRELATMDLMLTLEEFPQRPASAEDNLREIYKGLLRKFDPNRLVDESSASGGASTPSASTPLSRNARRKKRIASGSASRKSLRGSVKNKLGVLGSDEYEIYRKAASMHQYDPSRDPELQGGKGDTNEDGVTKLTPR